MWKENESFPFNEKVLRHGRKTKEKKRSQTGMISFNFFPCSCRLEMVRWPGTVTVRRWPGTVRLRGLYSSPMVPTSRRLFFFFSGQSFPLSTPELAPWACQRHRRLPLSAISMLCLNKRPTHIQRRNAADRVASFVLRCRSGLPLVSWIFLHRYWLGLSFAKYHFLQWTDV